MEDERITPVNDISSKCHVKSIWLSCGTLHVSNYFSPFLLIDLQCHVSANDGNYDLKCLQTIEVGTA